jgi:hypothetical protein
VKLQDFEGNIIAHYDMIVKYDSLLVFLLYGNLELLINICFVKYLDRDVVC